MRTRVDSVLRDEARRFALRFACEDCVHWNATGNVTAVVTAGATAGVCGNGWPEGVARDALAGDEVAFCKEFELGIGG
jgi:hypothetical protein